MEGEEKNGGWNNFPTIIDGFSGDDSDIGVEISDDHLKKLRQKEKTRSILIVVLGIGALFLGLIVFIFNIQNPFLSIILKGQQEQALEREKQRQLLLVMQTQDTDKDGLTDYDELNQYGTSPYLADSDSDGLSDKIEVDRGGDPNCPEGQSCFAAGENGTSTSYAAPTLNSNLSTQESPSITIEFIRRIMREAGMTDEEINSLSDQEVMAEFASYLNDNPDIAQELANQGYDFSGLSGLAVKTNKSTSTPVQTAPKASSTLNIDLKSLNISSVDDLKKLSGAQVRQLMINSGASAEVLASVTDDQLKEMFIKQIEAKLNINNN